MIIELALYYLLYVFQFLDSRALFCPDAHESVHHGAAAHLLVPFSLPFGPIRASRCNRVPILLLLKARWKESGVLPNNYLPRVTIELH